MTKFNFKPGDLVDYCGMEAVVIENHGNKGTVMVEGAIQEFKWRFDGVDTTLVRSGQEIVDRYKNLGPGDKIDIIGNIYTIVKNCGSYGKVEDFRGLVDFWAWEGRDYRIEKV